MPNLRTQIEAMVPEGFTPALIAERLGCSVRHVRRVAEVAGLAFWTNPLIGTGDERSVLWLSHLEAGASFRQVAFRHGVSHELVRQAWQSACTGSRIAA